MTEQTPVNPSEITLRDAAEQDASFFERLFFETRRDEFAVLGWEDAQLAPLLAMQFNVQTQAYKMQYPDARIRVIEARGAPVGRMITTDEINLVDIAVLRERQGHGIGSYVLKNLLAEAERAEKPVYLQVLKSNAAAFRLYERLGFTITGEDDFNLLMRRDVPR